jgi:hypothetical protein
MTATVTRFPLSKRTGGGGATPAFSGRFVYLQFMWEVPLPPSPVGLSLHSHFYKLSHCKVARWVPPFLPSPACLFTVLWGIAPHPLFSAQGAPPSLLHVFFCCLLFRVFFLFSLGGGSVCPGCYDDLTQSCLWEYHVPLSSPSVLHLSSQ